MSLKNPQNNKKNSGAFSGSMVEIGRGSFGKNALKKDKMSGAFSGSLPELGKGSFGETNVEVSIHIRLKTKLI